MPVIATTPRSTSSLAISLRVLFLLAKKGDYLALTPVHFIIGFACTWIVGIGRYWDNPRVGALQLAGFGSLVYVFILAALLWIVGLPFRDANWKYRRILTLVVLSSPPAAVYALPVERWYDLGTAREINVWFLVGVATWRMAIWGRFVWAMLPPLPHAKVATIFLPVVAIVTALAILNLEKAVFMIMAGIHGESPPPTADDSAYMLLNFGGMFCVYILFPFLLIVYALAWSDQRKLRTSAKNLIQGERNE